jgi:hypothetical protein
MSLSLIRFTTCLWSRAVCACLATVVLCESPVAAQSQRPEQKTETKTATVVEVQQKGRGRTLVVDDGAGQQSEYPLTPRIALEVTGRGDAGFVRAGQFLSAKGTMTNNKLFLKELTIHVAKRGTRLPAGRFAKAPPQEGDSTESYLVSGAIVASQADKDYPDYLLVGLKLPGQIPPILLEPGFVVTVVSNDPDLIPAGAPVDLELAPLRGGRFNLVRATVRVAEELQVEKVLGGGPPESESPAPAKAVPDAAAAPAKEPGAE